MKTKHAFTLLELLVVIAIIAALAGLFMPVLATMRKKADRIHATNNFRNLAAGMLAYTAANSLELPLEGESQPTWESSASPESANAWYNAIPRILGGKGVADYADKPDSFYDKTNLLFIPAATYPEKRKDRPFFAISMNSKLRVKELSDGAVRLPNMEQPGRTVIFQESGLPDEQPLPGQKKYDGQPKSFASRTAARYDNRAHLIFADGHVELLDARKVVAPSGKAFFPQTGDGGGEVLWTLDPDADANQ